MRSACTPIVTGFQGLDDKNFDIRTDAETATGHKTKFTMDTDLNKLNLSELPPDSRKAVESYKEEYAKIMMMQEREIRSTQFENGVKYSEEDVVKLLKRFQIQSETSGKLKDIKTKAIDKLVIDDLVAAMEDRAGRSVAEKQKMMQNAIKLASGWQNNGKIQHLKNGKVLSAAELYQERHFAPSVKNQSNFGYTSIKNVFFKLFGNKSGTTQAATTPPVNIPTPQNPGISGGIGSTSKEGIQELSGLSKYLNKETAIAFLGIAALGSLAYYIFKPEKSDTTTKEKDSNTYVA